MWLLLNSLGVLAFASSGAFAAVEADFDLFGVIVVALSASLGGGVIRDTVVGLPADYLWQQSSYIWLAIGMATLVYFLPEPMQRVYAMGGIIVDAIALGAYAVEGALLAEKAHLPMVAILFAAVMTGIGGGVIRDLLVGRRPLVFQKELYAVWAGLGGLVVATHVLYAPLAALFVTVLRLISYRFGWSLPRGRHFVKSLN